MDQVGMGRQRGKEREIMSAASSGSRGKTRTDENMRHTKNARAVMRFFFNRIQQIEYHSKI